jgi:spore maturation protein CgeB
MQPSAPQHAQRLKESGPASSPSYRILCIGETWRGSDAKSAFDALVRLGHDIQVIDEWHFFPTRWRSLFLRAMRKLLSPLLVRQLTRAATTSIKDFRPHLLFVFKGRWVHERVVERASACGVASVNIYPDVSFTVHGPYLPRTLKRYDQVFNTKSYGIADMKKRLGITNVSLMPPGFDPALHRPLKLKADEHERFDCDVAFIGTWSPKKEQLLSALKLGLPQVQLRIWGCQWERRSVSNLDTCIEGREVTGDEYVKAICGAKICLGLLSEMRSGASSGDLITARTFQIPACGAFMLHERNVEVAEYFEEDVDVVFFANANELATKTLYYLQNDSLRSKIARAGLSRSHRDHYSIDERLGMVVEWFNRRLALDQNAQ